MGGKCGTGSTRHLNGYVMLHLNYVCLYMLWVKATGRQSSELNDNGTICMRVISACLLFW